MKIDVYRTNRKINAKKQIIMLKVANIMLTKTIVFAKDKVINDNESK